MSVWGAMSLLAPPSSSIIAPPPFGPSLNNMGFEAPPDVTVRLTPLAEVTPCGATVTRPEKYSQLFHKTRT